MKIVHIHDRPLAGMPYRLEEAQRRYWPDAEICRIQMAGPDADSAMGFPPGLPVGSRLPDGVDIVHLHQLVAVDAAPSLVSPQDLWRARVVLTIHGDPDRGSVTEIPYWVDAVSVVTPDLLMYYPTATFIPNFALPGTLGRPGEFSSHSPPVLYRWSAYRDDKAFGFRELTERLNGSWRIVDETPELRPHESIMAGIFRADACWDHLRGYFGLTSIEAIALGVLPIVHLTSDVSALLAERLGCAVGELPFLSGPLPMLTETLKFLAKSPDALYERQDAAHVFWVKYWAPGRIVGWYDELYRGAA